MKGDTGIPRVAIVILVTCVVFIGFAFAGVVYFAKLAVDKRMKNRQAMKELNEEAQKYNSQARERIGSGDGVTGASDRAKEFEESLGRIAAKASGDEAKNFKATQQIMSSIRVRLTA